jgi:N-formylglutamate amidohydrolase
VRRALARAAIGACVIATPSVALAASEDFLLVQSGAMPLILTAPHGGTAMAGLPARHRGTLTRDVNTLELTEALALRLTAILGTPPYVVAARFSRLAIDANRSADAAFDDDSARPLYLAYHARIQAFVAEIRRHFPKGALLIDIHGQGAEALAVFRGTRNGQTVLRLLARAGSAALIGPTSILGALQAKGYAVIPPNTPPGEPRENIHYDGGFTVATYSREPDGIDALQLELGATLRGRPSFVGDLAEAIASFARAYLANPAKPD